MLPASLNEGHNIRLTEGYTSAAGKTYFLGISLSDRLLIKFKVSQGYNSLFLNGIELYRFEGKDAKMISHRAYHCQLWSEKFARNECKDMLKDFLETKTEMLRK